MANTAQAVLAWPAMKIFRVDDRTKETDRIVGRFTLVVGNRILVVAVEIAPARVNWKSVLWWQVAECLAQGQTSQATVLGKLPIENTRWSWRDFTMVAAEMQVPTVVLLDDGSRWEGPMKYPRCRISGILSDTQTAEPVTCTGMLTQVS